MGLFLSTVKYIFHPHHLPYNQTIIHQVQSSIPKESRNYTLQNYCNIHLVQYYHPYQYQIHPHHNLLRHQIRLRGQKVDKTICPLPLLRHLTYTFQFHSHQAFHLHQYLNELGLNKDEIHLRDPKDLHLLIQFY